MSQFNSSSLNLVRRVNISVGGISRDGLFGRIDKSGECFISSSAQKVISRYIFTEFSFSEPIEIEFGCILVKDLGFIIEPTTRELVDRVKEIGDICPVEAVPYFLLADGSQPENSKYWIARNVASDGKNPSAWFVVHNCGISGRWLLVHYVRSNHRWNLGRKIVFLL